ncbi:hypothetical protein MJ1HA_1315 [Metallosphaera sedula]|nr:hypothetical protein MJ1HA_1315 [Metallosphaera sedula]
MFREAGVWQVGGVVLNHESPFKVADVKVAVANAIPSIKRELEIYVPFPYLMGNKESWV